METQVSLIDKSTVTRDAIGHKRPQPLASESITSGVVLARSVVWNLIGQGAPMLLAVFTIPLLIMALGTDRFGILTLAWMIVSNISLFDLGLGRALTQMIAKRLGRGQSLEIAHMVWTSLFLMTALGLVGTAIMIIVSPLLVHNLIKIPTDLQTETLRSFYLLAVSMPIVICTAGLRGVLEAIQRFDLTSTVRIAIGVFTFIGPILVLPFSKSLLPIVLVLVVGRILTLALLIVLCLDCMPTLKYGVQIQRRMFGPLLRSGSWMTVSTLVTPLMMYLDRFVIGGLISIAALAYYATPFEVTTKLLVIPSALVGVLFPAFGSMFSYGSHRTADLYYRGVKYVFLVLFPITLIIVGFAKEILLVWLGVEFAENSYHVMQTLAIGVLLNGIANVPFALVQGAGRADLTARLNLLELPLYLATLWWLIHAHGIVGAAVAWSLRMAIDAFILLIIAHALLGRPRYHYSLIIVVAFVLVALGFELLIQPFSMRLVGVVIFLLTYAWVVRTALIDGQERLLFKEKLESFILRDHPNSTRS